MPEVSIGMPVYNMAGTIREAVRSLAEQTFGDFELLIADNVSTDGTEAICRELAASDPRIRYIRHEQHRPVIENFRFVFEQTTGEFFMWAAADDIWMPRFIETAVAGLRAHPKAVAGFSNIMVRGVPTGDYTIETLSRLGARGLLRRVTRYILQRDNKGKANLIYGLLRRRNVDRCVYGLRPPMFGLDMLFIFDLLVQGPYVMAEEPLFVKRHSKNDLVRMRPLGYFVDNLRHSWTYAIIAWRARGAAFALFTAMLAAVKYVRDAVVRCGVLIALVPSRLRRLRPA